MQSLLENKCRKMSEAWLNLFFKWSYQKKKLYFIS